MISHNLLAVVIFAAVLGCLVACEQLGHWLGSRAASKREAAAGDGQVAALEAAVLGLLALLIGFSFSSAIGRFNERRDIIVREANAIGTAYLRADLLSAATRDRLQALLRDYANTRVDLFERGFREEFDVIRQTSEELHGALWETARAGVEEKPAVTMAVLPPLNDVIDLHTIRIASMRRHTPVVATIGLVLTSSASLLIVGYAYGLVRSRHRWLSRSFALLTTGVLWVTFDLDNPRIGLMRIDDTAMVEVRDSISRR